MIWTDELFLSSVPVWSSKPEHLYFFLILCIPIPMAIVIVQAVHGKAECFYITKDAHHQRQVLPAGLDWNEPGSKIYLTDVPLVRPS
jgi:hypothetical protein